MDLRSSFSKNHDILQYCYQRTDEQTQTFSGQFIVGCFHRITESFPNRGPLKNAPNCGKNAPNQVKFVKKGRFLVENRQKTQKCGAQINRHPDPWIGVVVLQCSKKDKDNAEGEMKYFHGINGFCFQGKGRRVRRQNVLPSLGS